MNLLAITLLLTLAVVVSVIQRPVEYGEGIFRDGFGGQGWGSSRNFGNWGYVDRDRFWYGPYSGDNYDVYGSVGNAYGRGISGGNWAENYDVYGSVGNTYGRRISGGNWGSYDRNGGVLGRNSGGLGENWGGSRASFY